MARMVSVLALLAVVGAVIAWSSMFVIDETRQAIVVQFGEPRRTVKDPGIHFKLPWEQVEKMDRRVLGGDNPPSTYFTRDKKRLFVDPVTRWRVEEPLTFYKKMRTELGAKARLDDIINSELRKQLARRDFDEIVCVSNAQQGVTGPTKGGDDAEHPKPPAQPDQDDRVGSEESNEAEDRPDPDEAQGEPASGSKPAGPAPAPPGQPDPGNEAEGGASGSGTPPRGEPPAPALARGGPARAERPIEEQFKLSGCGRERLMEEVTKLVRRQVTELGITVLDVRMRRTDLPAEVERSVFDRMRAERERVAAKYRSEGEEENLKIRAETDKTTAILLAEAYEAAQRLRGQGDGESTRIYAEAFGKDIEFYTFVRSLDTYDKAMGAQSTLVFSTSSPLFKYLEEHRKR